MQKRTCPLIQAIENIIGEVSISHPAKNNAAIERPRLYVISPPKIALTSYIDEVKSALDGGDIACFQLRLKDCPDEEIILATKELMPLIQSYDVAFLLNDNPELAKKLGVDGVHIGQDDMPYKQTREIMGDRAIVGVTCHNSKHLAMQAAEQGADYVAFGAFYETATKQPKTRATPDLLEWWSAIVEIPAVAIGGITQGNCAALLDAGADFIAVSGAIWQHPVSPKQSVADFNRLIDNRTTT